MTKSYSYGGGGKTSLNFHAEVPALIKPVITRSRTIKGLFYFTACGRRFEAVAFDKMFAVAAPHRPVMDAHYKGENPAKKLM